MAVETSERFIRIDNTQKIKLNDNVVKSYNKNDDEEDSNNG